MYEERFIDVYSGIPTLQLGYDIWHCLVFKPVSETKVTLFLFTFRAMLAAGKQRGVQLSLSFLEQINCCLIVIDELIVIDRFDKQKIGLLKDLVDWFGPFTYCRELPWDQIMFNFKGGGSLFFYSNIRSPF